MCEQLLTNPLIESYAIELDGVPVEDVAVPAIATRTEADAT